MQFNNTEQDPPAVASSVALPSAAAHPEAVLPLNRKDIEDMG